MSPDPFVHFAAQLARIEQKQEQLSEQLSDLCAVLRRQAPTAELEAAWREVVGPAPMTTAELLRWVEADPYDPLSVALAAFADFSKPGRAVSLGKRLATLPWLETARDEGRGVVIFTLRGGD